MSIDYMRVFQQKVCPRLSLFWAAMAPVLVGILTGCSGSSESASGIADSTPSAEVKSTQIFTPDDRSESSNPATNKADDQLATYGGGAGGASYAGETTPPSGLPGANSGGSREWTPDGDEGDPTVFGGGALGSGGMTGPQGPPAGSFGPPGPGVMGGTMGPPARGGPPGFAGRNTGGGSPPTFPGGMNMGGPDDFADGPATFGFGMGTGLGGPAMGPAAGGFGLVSTFVQQNCLSCHSALNPKGNVRLDQISPDLSASSDLWQNVLLQLESGAMPPASSRQPDPAQKVMVIEFIRDTLGTVSEMTYMQQSEMAFRRGDREEAMKLFYAHALTVDDDEAAQVLNHIKLYRPRVSKPEDLIATSESATTIRPRLDTQLTFAVGILLDVSSQVTDVKPIGVRQFGGAAGGLGGGDIGDMQGFGRAGGGGSASSKLEAFEDLTGDYGKTLVEAYKQRLTDGRFGTLFADLRAGGGEKRTPGAQQPGAAGFAGGGGRFSDGPDNSDFGNPGGGRLGMAGGGMGPGGALGDPDGVGGFGIGGMGIGGMGASGGNAPRTLENQDLASGLTYLGVGTINQLLERAVGLNADGLFLFDIKASRNPRNRIVTNDTRLRFMLSSGKVVATVSRTLKNIDIERAIQQNKDSDDVQKQIDHIFGRLDDILVFEEVPKMSDAAAMRHIHGQYHSAADPLQIMAEARLFHLNGIISAQQLATVCQVVLEGNEGISLAEGTEADRKMVLNLFMPDL